MVAGGPSCNPAPSAAINPCVALRAKYYGDDTDPNLVMSTGGNFELETQILRIRSEQTPESQVKANGRKKESIKVHSKTTNERKGNLI